MFKVHANRRLVPTGLLTFFLVLTLSIYSSFALAQVEKGTIRTASPVPPTSLGNPFARDDGTSTRVAIFDALTSLSRDAKLQPALAKSWHTDSPKTWIFNLRDNVVFHNNEPFTAEDVVATLNYLKSPEAAQFFVTRYVASIKSARVIAPLTVVIETHLPDPILPNRLANVVIVEPKAWRELGVDGFAQEPVGTGPFSLVDWGAATRVMKLEAFEQSWRQTKTVKRVQISVLPDSTTRLQALLSDQVDIAVNLDPDSIPQLEAAGLNVIVMPAPHIIALALRNVGEVSEPMRDKRVRQALNYAVNKQMMAEQILYGHVRVASQATTPEVFGYNPRLTPYEYDPERARSLLNQSGYTEGIAFTFGVFSGQTPADTLLFQLMRQDLAAVGVDITLRLLSLPDILRRNDSGKWDEIDAFSSTLSSAWFGDASQAIERMSCDYPTPFFCEPDVTDLIKESEQEMNRGRRESLLQSILARFHDLAPALLLVDYSAITGTSTRVSNYKARSNGVQFEDIMLVE